MRANMCKYLVLMIMSSSLQVARSKNGTQAMKDSLIWEQKEKERIQNKRHADSSKVKVSGLPPWLNNEVGHNVEPAELMSDAVIDWVFANQVQKVKLGRDNIKAILTVDAELLRSMGKGGGSKVGRKLLGDNQLHSKSYASTTCCGTMPGGEWYFTTRPGYNRVDITASTFGMNRVLDSWASDYCVFQAWWCYLWAQKAYAKVEGYLVSGSMEFRHVAHWQWDGLTGNAQSAKYAGCDYNCGRVEYG